MFYVSDMFLWLNILIFNQKGYYERCFIHDIVVDLFFLNQNYWLYLLLIITLKTL